MQIPKIPLILLLVAPLLLPTLGVAAARLPAEARAPLLPVIQRLAQLKTRDSLSPTRYTASDAERIMKDEL